MVLNVLFRLCDSLIIIAQLKLSTDDIVSFIKDNDDIVDNNVDC